MTPICTCRLPIIRNGPTEGSKVCDRCGCWYDLRHGSRTPSPDTSDSPLGKFDSPSPEEVEQVDWREKARTTLRATRGVTRNDPCPCKSGVKYKNCCMMKVERLRRLLLEPVRPNRKYTFDK